MCFYSSANYALLRGTPQESIARSASNRRPSTYCHKEKSVLGNSNQSSTRGREMGNRIPFKADPIHILTSRLHYGNDSG